MDAAQEVKSRLNIEDVVSEYVQLKRAGRNFKGISPWTNEKTPSFIVSPEKQIWHDFSSGKGGDIFGFVMEMEGLDFKGALETLARKAGVDLAQYKKTGSSSANANLKARAQEALELSIKFYQKQLTANRPALEYLIKKRGFSKQTIINWRLGYAPNTARGLSDFLTKQGFTTDEMKRAGLISQRQGYPADMFRGRIMVPLTDSRGMPVGFTARLVVDQPNAPKYINTPQTILYDKSRNVFGLAQAKNDIRKLGFVVAVEGNLDVIASHQAGIANVVASAGTAMTEYHLRELKRFSGDVRLSFDADRAGISATERVIPLSQKVDVSLKIISLPAGFKDPDELVKKDASAWQKAIDSAVYAPDWLMEVYEKQLDLASAAGKRSFSDLLLPIIKRLSDPLEQEHYLKKIAELTDTSLETVKAKLAGGAGQPQVRLKRPNLKPAEVDKLAVEHRRLQDHFLSILLAQPKLRRLLKDCRAAYFSDGPPRILFEFLTKNPNFKSDAKTAGALQEISDYVKIVILQFEELYSDLPAQDLALQAQNLARRLVDYYVKIQKTQLILAINQAKDETETQKLIKKVDKLNQLIKG
ncbi:MAG TPA: DNA primase [Candidatus Saccharimonadales bacterium]|nr:DNA primase [Candidatus Saccharimonadales bacterium]